jgi:hypothetical protein
MIVLNVQFMLSLLAAIDVAVKYLDMEKKKKV